MNVHITSALRVCISSILFFYMALSATAVDILLPVKKGELWGYSDLSGTLRIPAKFLDAQRFSQNLAAVAYNGTNVDYQGRYGYIDSSGKWLITPGYYIANSFSEGLAAVQNGLPGSKAYHGYINTKGIFVIKPTFAGAYPFSNGEAIVWQQSIISKLMTEWIDEPVHAKTLIINRLGKVPRKRGVNLYPFSRDGAWGFKYGNGNEAIKPKYSKAIEFTEGLGAVCIDDKWGFINKKDEIVIKPQFKSVWPFSESLSAARMDEKLWGYIDQQGKWAITPRFSKIEPFIDGIACVEYNGRSVYVNSNGTALVYKERPDGPTKPSEFSVEGDLNY